VRSLLPPPATAPSYPNARAIPCISVGAVRPIVGIAIVRSVVEGPIVGVAIVGPVVEGPIVGVAIVGPVDVGAVDVDAVSVAPIAPGIRRCRGEEGCGREDGRRRTKLRTAFACVALRFSTAPAAGGLLALKWTPDRPHLYFKR
jgi:hypothetical protein